MRSLGYQRKQEGIESRNPYRSPTSFRQAETEPAAGEAAISVGKVSFAILLFLKMLEDIRVDRSDPLPNPQLIEQAAAPLLPVLVVAHSFGDELGVDSIREPHIRDLVDDRPVDPGQSSPSRRLSTPG